MRKLDPVLFIPHYCSEHIKTRSLELAKSLAKDCEVYYLNWQMYPDAENGLPSKLISRVRTDLDNLFRRFSVETREGVHHVWSPVAQSSILTRLGARKLLTGLNQLIIRRLLRALRIKLVINAHEFLFPLPDGWNGTYVYDVVDDTIGQLANRRERTAAQAVRTEAAKAALTTTISLTLCDKLQRLFGIQAHYSPNGANVSEFESVTGTDRSEVRRRYGLEGNWVIGFIGNHAKFSGLSFLCETFARLHRVAPTTRLFVVGPVDRKFERHRSAPGTVWTGPVPPKQIAKYFSAVDVGVLPFEKCPLTDAALPIKVVEYGAARKLVVASALDELKRLGLPHVVLLDASPEAWLGALAAARTRTWEPRWDPVIRRYEWDAVAKDMVGAALKSLSAHADESRFPLRETS